MRRFESTPLVRLVGPGGEPLDSWVAESAWERLAGLALLRELPAGKGLLLPRCRSVHTVGMRFAIDVAFLSWPPVRGCSAVMGLEASVQPWRVVRHRGPVAALEAPAGRLEPLGVVPGEAVRLLDCTGSVSDSAWRVHESADPAEEEIRNVREIQEIQ